MMVLLHFAILKYSFKTTLFSSFLTIKTCQFLIMTQIHKVTGQFKYKWEVTSHLYFNYPVTLNHYFFSIYMLIFDINEQMFWSFIKRFVHWFPMLILFSKVQKYAWNEYKQWKSFPIFVFALNVYFIVPSNFAGSIR